MSFDYSGSQATATGLLQQFGRSITRHAATNGDYDPATGSGTATFTDSTRTGVLLNYTGKDSGQQFVRGNLVLATDKKLLIDGSASALVTDQYTIGSDRYSVISVSTLNPAGATVLHELHVRLS